ncbi:MAG: hypothetical protein RLZZ453_1224 [Chlamydiota bacterium]|jgi:dihydrofolate synthase/folylpolyglutamate synthase
MKNTFGASFSDYDSVLSALFAIPSAHGLAQDISRAEMLYKPLSYPTIHIAGSNGKGSVATKIAASLQHAGYRVGLYTSPHLFDYRERICINGEMIPKEEVLLLLQELFDRGHHIHPTFFEYTTLLAFEYFRKAQVDVAVIEAGIGGRFDATNVITPILSVITSISQEHTALLGRNLEEIGFQKAGIIKPCVPVVLGPKINSVSILKEAQRQGSPIYLSTKTSPLFDEENQAIAELSLQVLKPHFGSIQPLSVRPPCRLEKRGSIIFDVAHNPDAITRLLKALEMEFPDRTFRFLVGFSSDKDYNTCLSLIASVASHIHLVQSPSSRSVPIAQLASALNPTLCTSHPCIKEGMQQAHNFASERGELLVVCGSFYIMQQIYPTDS